MSDSNIRTKFRSLLDALDYHEAKSYFTFGDVPQTLADLSYIIDRNRMTPLSEQTTNASQRLYVLVEVTVRILFKINPNQINTEIDDIHDKTETIIGTVLTTSNFPTNIPLVSFISKTVSAEINDNYAVADIVFGVQDINTF